jgi:uncharacterized membrane protein YfhO
MRQSGLENDPALLQATSGWDTQREAQIHATKEAARRVEEKKAAAKAAREAKKAAKNKKNGVVEPDVVELSASEIFDAAKNTASEAVTEAMNDDILAGNGTNLK